MYTGKTLFTQVMDFLPWKTFHRLVSRYNGDHRVRMLPCAEHFRVLAFAQLTYRESLRDCTSSQFLVSAIESRGGGETYMGHVATVVWARGVPSKPRPLLPSLDMCSVRGVCASGILTSPQLCQLK